jgi:NADP-dependent 3-hydroxy acid dehydrogenase YdfG
MVDVNFNAVSRHAGSATRDGGAGGAGTSCGRVHRGRSAFVGGACYAATKHAVMGFSESLMPGSATRREVVS